MGDEVTGILRPVLKRWTPWAWAWAATLWLIWEVWLGEATGWDGSWEAAVLIGGGLIALPVMLAHRADRKAWALRAARSSDA